MLARFTQENKNIDIYIYIYILINIKIDRSIDEGLMCVFLIEPCQYLSALSFSIDIRLTSERFLQIASYLARLVFLLIIVNRSPIILFFKKKRFFIFIFVSEPFVLYITCNMVTGFYRFDTYRF